jgi:DNA repair ATPase RecN
LYHDELRTTLRPVKAHLPVAYHDGMNVADSVRHGVMGAGKGVLVTALTMAAGLMF